MDVVKKAWTEALPAIFRLIDGRKRDLFRHELQRFLAFSRMKPADAAPLVEPLRELLLQSARAAQQPAAIHATRSMAPDAASLSELAEHLLACWRSAEAAAEAGATATSDGMAGPTFFGTRLGGPRRRGSVTRKDLGLDD
jgi:hypothetical protein